MILQSGHEHRPCDREMTSRRRGEDDTAGEDIATANKSHGDGTEDDLAIAPRGSSVAIVTMQRFACRLSRRAVSRMDKCTTVCQSPASLVLYGFKMHLTMFIPLFLHKPAKASVAVLQLGLASAESAC